MAEETKKEKNTAKIDTAKQAKLKKQAEVEDQDEKLKQEDPQELRSKLSNKNSDYVPLGKRTAKARLNVT